MRNQVLNGKYVWVLDCRSVFTRLHSSDELSRYWDAPSIPSNKQVSVTMWELWCAASSGLYFEIWLLSESHFVPSDTAVDSSPVMHQKGCYRPLSWWPIRDNNNPRHSRQEPWLSSLGQWTHLNKIKCALHFLEIGFLCQHGQRAFHTNYYFLSLFHSLSIPVAALCNRAIRNRSEKVRASF